SDQQCGRVLGNAEKSWCRAVISGTGITILGLRLSKQLAEKSRLTEILDALKRTHPLLGCKLAYDRSGKTFKFVKPEESPPPTEVSFRSIAKRADGGVPTLQEMVEQEMSENEIWSDPNAYPADGADVLLASVYAISGSESVVILRFHTSVCDRTTAVSLLRELLERVSAGGLKMTVKNGGEGEWALENLIPNGLTKKRIWAHGKAMLGYSLGSLRMTNLEFVNCKKMPRKSEIIRLQLNQQITSHILAGCKAREIKLCGAISAAAILAAHPNKAASRNYGVVTLTDCRSLLQPPLSPQHYGFYHLAILNIHPIKGTETLWDLATSCYTDFSKFKQNNKQFTDMTDLQFLMTKALENPVLTPQSALRSSLVTVFEDPVIDNSGDMRRDVGVGDYIGCSSVHGIGPSIGIFDTVRDGELDCIIVYPSPLHSRQQMEEIVAKMAAILV
ncbi:hypothetical protein M569_04096, partial [Genlisea aurea]